ncbi:hypothetical protein CASFOL_009987 [Castilleja foliolosa]|uniref:Uncharacterized protein n=1 Tax=Castilleja foliolosa TaxID=1961234 RepID=A0ABD3DTJ1_9LAMI
MGVVTVAELKPSISGKRSFRPCSSAKQVTEWPISDVSSDLTIEVGTASFSLHKFPLVSKSGRIRKQLTDAKDSKMLRLNLSAIPGGPHTFETAAKFCYGMNIEITASNVAHLRCAAHFLEMTEEYSDKNLESKTEAYLKDSIFPSIPNSITVLHHCETLLPTSEDINLVSRTINAIANNACKEQLSSGLSKLEHNNYPSKPGPISDFSEIPWGKSLTSLNLDFFQRVLSAVKIKGLKQDIISRILIHYAQNSLAVNKKSDLDSQKKQRVTVETIVSLLPTQSRKSAVPIAFLSTLLKSAIASSASTSCRSDLERRIGLQLDQAILEDILIPSCSHGNNHSPLYDTDSVLRVFSTFLNLDEDDDEEDISNCNQLRDESEMYDFDSPGSPKQSSLTKVSKLLDNYLAEVALDTNLTPSKLTALAELLPDHARVVYDGLYRSVDIFLKLVKMSSDDTKKMKEEEELLEKNKELTLRIAEILEKKKKEKKQNDQIPQKPHIEPKLNETNYSMWARKVELALGGVDRWHHITDDPPKKDEPEYKTWARNDLQVLCWLIDSIETDLSGQFIEYPNAKELWKGAYETYRSGEDALHIYDLNVRANRLQQGEQSIEKYYQAFTSLWREMDRRDHNDMETPGDILKLNRRIQTYRLYQFLHGANPKLDPVKRDLLKESPLPSVETAYAALRREASRVMIVNHTKKEEIETSGYVSQKQKTKTESKNETVDKKKLQCDHCKKTGHLKKGCYELIGYPDWFKSNPKFQGKKKGGVASAETADNASENGDDDENLHFAAAVAAAAGRRRPEDPAGINAQPRRSSSEHTRRRHRSPETHARHRRSGDARRSRLPRPRDRRLSPSPSSCLGKRPSTSRPRSEKTSCTTIDRAKKMTQHGSGPPPGSGPLTGPIGAQHKPTDGLEKNEPLPKPNLGLSEIDRPQPVTEKEIGI